MVTVVKTVTRDGNDFDLFAMVGLLNRRALTVARPLHSFLVQRRYSLRTRYDAITRLGVL